MRVDWQKTASMLFCVLVAAGTFFLVGKYAVTIVMPFLIAWGLALSLRPPAKHLAKRSGLSLRFCAVILLLLTFAVIGTLLFFGINRLVTELARLVERFSSGEIPVSVSFSHWAKTIDRLGAHLPFSDDGEKSFFQEQFGNMILTAIRDIGSKLITAVTALATSLIRSLPSIMLFVIVTVIASFYFALDLDTVHRAAISILPTAISKKLPDLKLRTRRFAGKYLRAYLLLMFLTFCELFVGFSVLSVEYSFLLALVISTVDILPALGVGTVLIPWSVIELLTRDFKTGFGLLILWAVITVVRQIIEPKIVGGSLGLHPLVTLIGMYVGFRLFGIIGLLASPALAVAAKVILKEWFPRSQTTEFESRY